MRLWNGLIPHSIVKYNGKMYRIARFYEEDGKKFADLIDNADVEVKKIDIMELEKVDD